MADINESEFPFDLALRVFIEKEVNQKKLRVALKDVLNR